MCRSEDEPPSSSSHSHLEETKTAIGVDNENESENAGIGEYANNSDSSSMMMMEVTETLIRNGTILWSTLLPRSKLQALMENSEGEVKADHVDEPEIFCNKEASSSKHLEDHVLSMTVGERIKEGLTVITITNVLTIEEVQSIKQTCIDTAQEKGKTNRHPVSSYYNAYDNENIQNRKVFRLPCRSAAIRHSCLKDVLPSHISDQLENDILPRIFRIVDHQLPTSLKRTIFVSNKPKDENLVYRDRKDCTDIYDENEEISIFKLYREKRVYFSTREPAINVYIAPKGFIGTHKDKEHLTTLISFSDPTTEFEGGGTGFYKESFVQEGRHEPSHIVRPSQPGTVIIFGGLVAHCGLHTRKGTRVMFVCSFSRDDSQQQATTV